MAERSFAAEVQSLRLGAGEEFRGEGILAVTKALLQSGVGYVGGYQGAPISHLMDVLADAEDILQELGVHFEASASEATAAAMLAASINYPIRGAVTWKSTVGTNVASDALANLASAGVRGGALIVVGEDYGEGASIMQERTHAFAMKSQIWLLDPRPQLPAIVRAVQQGFELSEASNTPVMLMLRIRACHVSGHFTAAANRKPAFSAADALAAPSRDYERIILPPSTFAQEKEKIEKRFPAAVKYVAEAQLNEFIAGEAEHIGIVLQGGLYNSALRALELLGCADTFGQSRIPLYCLNVTYPLVPQEWSRFCAGKQAILVLEEGQPEFIEQAASQILRRADLNTRLVGKDLLPMSGEYTVDVLRKGISAFLERWAPELRSGPARAKPQPVTVTETPMLPAARLASLVPARPSGLCTGCPERPFFAA
ncbi:MAG: indolepyruvate ferredoxin oxidoreductase subunit alpha, partial [Sinobacteraceae bacterium]|nr:indolepyruvate ferredoxin oxidoreductase subunit alpha [Nevskiaceae bacterium]